MVDLTHSSPHKKQKVPNDNHNNCLDNKKNKKCQKYKKKGESQQTIDNLNIFLSIMEHDNQINETKQKKNISNDIFIDQHEICEDTIKQLKRKIKKLKKQIVHLQQENGELKEIGIPNQLQIL